MPPAIKVRGIYATALTRFFIDEGFTVVEPSEVIEKRFAPDSPFPADTSIVPKVLVRDNSSCLGIEIEAGLEPVEKITKPLKRAFPFALFIKSSDPDKLEIVFSADSREKLDDLRNKVVPTLKGHHRFKGTEKADLVDLVEIQTLSANPHKREALGKNLERAITWDTYEEGKSIGIEHIKPTGKIIRLSPGKIDDFHPESGLIVIKREGFKPPGKYDGLKIAIRDGDYCQTRIRSNQWYYHHEYFRNDGSRIGQYWNVNTPIEVFSDKIRYVDLEIDVVKFADGTVKIVDDDLLKARLNEGVFTTNLYEKARKIASFLVEKLKSGSI